MRRKIILLVTVLLVIMLGSTVTSNAETTDELKYTGDLDFIVPHATEITFGEYPQTEIVDRSRTSGAYGKAWAKSTDYIVDLDLYAELAAAEYDDNNITDIKGVKYKRLLKAEAEYSSDDNDKHYDWPDDQTYHYFRFDPIKWRTLSFEDGKALLLAETALDVKPYNNYWEGVTWENCSARSWMNNEFINTAFTSEEQGAIQETKLSNPGNSRYGGSDTLDKVFLLSENDLLGATAVKYGFAKSNNEDEARMAKCSTYAKARGAVVDDGNYMGNCNWLLRTPGESNEYVEYVRGNGVVETAGDVVDQKRYAIRPALYLNAEKTDVYTFNTDRSKINSFNTFDLEKTSYLYDGSVRKPRVSIKGLIEGVDYTVTYANNDRPGTASVTVKGKGNWSGKITRTFKISFTSETAGEIKRDVSYKCYYYGKYPKREIVGSAEQCQKYKNAEENGYIVNKTLYNTLLKAKWNSKNNTVINGTKYHRLKKRGDYKYFKYEPIKWRCFYKNGNDLFLVSDAVLDQDSLQTVWLPISWSIGEAREWLNEDFYKTAFSKSARGFIKTTSLTTFYGKDNAIKEKTKDKIFLLTSSDLYNKSKAIKYGFLFRNNENDGTSYATENDKIKILKTTYAVERDDVTNQYPIYQDRKDMEGSVQIIPAMHVDLEDNTFIKDAGKTGVVRTLKYSGIKGLNSVEPLFEGKACPTVSLDGLRKDIDYTVSYASCDKKGIGTVIIKGKGKFTGTLTKTFAIVDYVDISDKKASLEYSTVCYQGKACKPAVSVEGLEEGRHYKVTYKNNNAVETATVTISGINGYKGTIKKNFIIKKGKDISGKTATLSRTTVPLSRDTMIHNDPFDVTIKGLTRGIDYKVTLSFPPSIGKGTVTIKGVGNYYGVIKKSFSVVLPKTRLSEITPKVKGSRFIWCTPTSLPHDEYKYGYIIRVSRYSSMERAKTYSVPHDFRKERTNQSLQIKDLASKRKYYVQIRTYFMAYGAKHYSDWSTKKSFTTK